jgi:hypothetical protein
VVRTIHFRVLRSHGTAKYRRTELELISMTNASLCSVDQRLVSLSSFVIFALSNLTHWVRPVWEMIATMVTRPLWSPNALTRKTCPINLCVGSHFTDKSSCRKGGRSAVNEIFRGHLRRESLSVAFPCEWVDATAPGKYEMTLTFYEARKLSKKKKRKLTLFCKLFNYTSKRVYKHFNL